MKFAHSALKRNTTLYFGSVPIFFFVFNKELLATFMQAYNSKL